MGLDISAYRKLSPAPEAEIDSDGCPVEWKKYAHFHESSLKWTEEHWPGYSGEIAPGIFSYAQAHGFRAGSYSGYGWWRARLAELAYAKPIEEVWETEKSGPFFELVHFADNEGVIGSAIAAKLAKDFSDYQERAEKFAATLDTESSYWLEKYNEWRKAFEMAADGGAVDFH